MEKDPETISREAKARYILSGERARATDLFNRLLRGERFFLYYKPYSRFVEVSGAYYGHESCLTGTNHFFVWKLPHWDKTDGTHATNFDLSDDKWEMMVLNDLGAGI